MIRQNRELIKYKTGHSSREVFQRDVHIWQKPVVGEDEFLLLSKNILSNNGI